MSNQTVPGDRLLSIETPPLKTCCFCASVETGTHIIGWLEMVLVLFYFIRFWTVIDTKWFITIWFVFVYLYCGFVFYRLLQEDSTHNRRRFFVAQIVVTVFYLLVTIVSFVLGLANWAGSLEFTLPLDLLQLMIHIYCVFVTKQHVLDLVNVSGSFNEGALHSNADQEEPIYERQHSLAEDEDPNTNIRYRNDSDF